MGSTFFHCSNMVQRKCLITTFLLFLNFNISSCTNVTYNKYVFKEELFKTINTKQYDQVRVLLSAPSVPLSDLSPEEKRVIAEALLSDKVLTSEFIAFLKEHPIDNFSDLVKQEMNNLMNSKDFNKSLYHLIELREAFPLIVGGSANNWIKRKEEELIDLDVIELILAKEKVFTSAYSKPTSISKVHLSDYGKPLELIAAGYWRLGLAIFLGGKPSNLAKQNFLASVSNNPMAFSQLYIMASVSFDELHVIPSNATGIAFHRIWNHFENLNTPIPICQTRSGKSLLIEPSVINELEQFGWHEKLKILQSLISMLTFKSIDAFPTNISSKLNRSASATQLFNDMVSGFCYGYDEMYPGLYVASI